MGEEAWGFIWLMVLLKIPIAALLWLVWWSVQATPEPEGADDEDGGIGFVGGHPSTPLPPAPRRRGPHGEPAPPAPLRTRRTGAPARDRTSR